MLSQGKGSGNRNSTERRVIDFGGLMIRTKDETATKRRIEINIDRQRLFVLKRRDAVAAEWCRECGRKVQMLTPDQAATIANVSSRTIYRRVEAGEMHYLETAEGFLLICPNSIRE